MSDLSSPSPASDATPSFISPVLMATERPTTPPVRLGVLASGSGSNFEAIAQAIADGKLHARIEVMVYNNPGVKAVARAERWGIPAVLVNHREFSQRETCDRKIVETLREYGVEWVIMFKHVSPLPGFADDVQTIKRHKPRLAGLGQDGWAWVCRALRRF